MPNNKDKIQSYFNKDFSDFNASYTEPSSIKDFIRKLAYRFNKSAIEGRMNALLDLVGSNLENVSILEVGSGPGFYSIELAKKGAKVVGVDYSNGMAEIAKRNAKGVGVIVDFKTGDFMHISLDMVFYCVFATGVIEYIEPNQQINFLKKMRDLSNGIIIVSFPKKYAFHAFIRTIWLMFFKKIRISFFSNRDITNLALICQLEEIDRRDIGILQVVKFKKTNS